MPTPIRVDQSESSARSLRDREMSPEKRSRKAMRMKTTPRWKAVTEDDEPSAAAAAGVAAALPSSL